MSRSARRWWRPRRRKPLDKHDYRRIACMPELHINIPDSLMTALEERRTRTGETTAEVIISALADALEVDHPTLFQVSNSTALTQGVFDGAVTVDELKEHGDFGLGTFD